MKNNTCPWWSYKVEESSNLMVASPLLVFLTMMIVAYLIGSAAGLISNHSSNKCTCAAKKFQ